MSENNNMKEDNMNDNIINENDVVKTLLVSKTTYYKVDEVAGVHVALKSILEIVCELMKLDKIKKSDEITMKCT